MVLGDGYMVNLAIFVDLFLDRYKDCGNSNP